MESWSDSYSYDDNNTLTEWIDDLADGSFDDSIDSTYDSYDLSYDSINETSTSPTSSPTSSTNANTMTEYWIEQQFGGKYKWTTLEHNGVLFPPDYIKHNVPVVYNGKNIVLDILAEEYATIYSRYTDTEYITSRIFTKNFWKDWSRILGKNHEIQNLESCDFSKIYQYLVEQKEKAKELTMEERKMAKTERDKQEAKYKVAIVDGMEQPVGNYRIEPPGIFIGRGCHPKMGSIKPRIKPEDITINIGKNAKIPPGNWAAIIHDRHAEWLASWIDAVTGKHKYVWLAAASKFKAESDYKKFELARKLKKNINKIRQTIEKDLSDNDETIQQAATALYLIDNFALRVGNEKGPDAADTVGVTSLRVEHIIFENHNIIKLDFLGKDSIRYYHTHNVSSQIYQNMKNFTKNKTKTDELFDKIDSTYINKYLQSLMKNLTAKVFRTYNASNLFQKELNKITKKTHNGTEDAQENNVNMILDMFNKANIKVALLCNHQKKVSKSFNTQLEKINEKIKTQQKKLAAIKRQQAKRTKKSQRDTDRIAKIKKQIAELKAKKKIKIELKSVSLETSKVNYIDPRITVAFIKKHNLPVDKIFSKTLQDRFKWAFDVDENWKF
jgi:DNA topoisomerase-1